MRQQRAPDEGLACRVSSTGPGRGSMVAIREQAPTASPRRRAAFRAGAGSHSGYPIHCGSTGFCIPSCGGCRIALGITILSGVVRGAERGHLGAMGMHTPSDKSYSGFERRVVKLASQHAGLPCGPFSQHLNRNRSRASCTSIIMQNGIFFPAASADYVGARRSLVRQYSVFVVDIIRF